MHPTITEAIKPRRVLAVVYDGDKRMVVPHVYGINSAGNEVVRSYQIGGSAYFGADDRSVRQHEHRTEYPQPPAANGQDPPVTAYESGRSTYGNWAGYRKRFTSCS